MAIHVKLIKNNIKSRNGYGKYYAKAVSQGEVTLDEIAAEACRNSGFTEGTVVGVVTELQELLQLLGWLQNCKSCLKKNCPMDRRSSFPALAVLVCG